MTTAKAGRLEPAAVYDARPAGCTPQQQQQYQPHQDPNDRNWTATKGIDCNTNQQPARKDQLSGNRHQVETERPRSNTYIIESISSDAINDNQADDEDEMSGEALLAVASAEEYAAKIIKIQQACLVPLKEDLADWLNKILKTSQMTKKNFMDKLENGVIICRLAKIISLWCEQQITGQNSNIQVQLAATDRIADADNYESPLPRPRQSTFAAANGPLRTTTSQSTSCLFSAAGGLSSTTTAGLSCDGDQFLNNLITMSTTKIWEDAKCRTFYARDNVCNFIRWSKGFGVNQSVLFESDDLVLHANPRQVVLCLLDVARIAYVKFNFTEAPGLVKFEQEIDKEIATRRASELDYPAEISNKAILSNAEQQSCSNNKESNLRDSNLSSRARNSRGMSIGDATDELVMRYCRHKEEEAARKRIEELENASLIKLESDLEIANMGELEEQQERLSTVGDEEIDSYPEGKPYEPDSLMPNQKAIETESEEVATITNNTTTSDQVTHNKGQNPDLSRVDSLDSGEGPTESASTGSQLPDSSSSAKCEHSESTTPPKPAKRTSFSPSLASQQTTSSITNSEISSSRSSLLSNQENTNTSSNFGRQITSDLDGKVMRIAKSYYGKEATKDVTRLSEGKYKIADRIVFVRLLKGHRVMVRIGGGWDTLENFLFRHKSDPSQVIDVDNLLPIEAKMSFEKSAPTTPITSRPSKLPYYKRSTSVSSTNLSASFLSASNHSLISSSTPSNRKFPKQNTKRVGSSPAHLNKQQIPNNNSPLKFSRAQQVDSSSNLKHNNSPHPAFHDNKDLRQGQQSIPLTQHGSIPQLKRPLLYQQKATSYSSKFNQQRSPYYYACSISSAQKRS